MYYGLRDIRRTALLYIIAAPFTFLASLAVVLLTYLNTADSQRALQGFGASTLMSLLVAGVGFYFLQVFTAAFVYKKVAIEKEGVTRLRETPPLPRPFGLRATTFEAATVVFAVAAAIILSIVLDPTEGFSGGGIVTGWLLSTGFARLRFVRKVGVEEKEQNRAFFFGDMNFGARTPLAYVPLGAEPEPVAATAPVRTTAGTTVKMTPQTQLQRRATAAPRPPKKRSSANRALSGTGRK